jgi:hypothetical protein
MNVPRFRLGSAKKTLKTFKTKPGKVTGRTAFCIFLFICKISSLFLGSSYICYCKVLVHVLQYTLLEMDYVEEAKAAKAAEGGEEAAAALAKRMVGGIGGGGYSIEG